MKKFNKLQIVLVCVLLLSLVITTVSCSCNSTIRQDGYAAVAIDDTNVYLATSDGNIVTLNKLNGVQSLEEIEVNNGSTVAGLLSCGMSGNSTVVYGTPCLNNNSIYVTGYDGNLYVFDTQSNTTNSVTLDTDKGMSIIGGPVYYEDMLYVGCSDGCLYAVNPETLETVWAYETGDKIWTTPLVIDGTVYFGSFDESIYALNAKDGSLKWSTKTNGAIISTPVYNDGILYVGSFDRSIYALNAEDGSIKWTYPGENETDVASKWFWSDMTIYGDVLCAPNTDGNVYFIDLDTGKCSYSYELSSSISAGSVVVGDNVLVISDDGTLYSINSNNCMVLHEFNNTCNADLVVDGELVYVHTQTEETLYAVNVNNGLVVWMYEV